MRGVAILADLLHKVAALKFEEEEEKQEYHPRPSLAGPERCIRQIVYMARGEASRLLPGRAVVVLNDSAWHEDLSLDLLRQSAFTPHSEQMGIHLKGVLPWAPAGGWVCRVCHKKIDNKDVHGHIDALVTDIIGVDRLVEHKALSYFGVEAIKKGELPFDYFSQMALYFRGLQQDNPDLQEGVLLIKNKNTSGYLEFLCSYNTSTDTFVVINKTDHNGEREEINLTISNATEAIFDRFRQVEEHRAAKTLPERQYEFDTWRCSYCLFTRACWENYPNEHKALTADYVFEGEIADLLKYKVEASMHLAEMKKEEEELKVQIKSKLKELGVRSGRAGDVIVDWKVGTRKKFNEELLPPNVYRLALEEVPTERLTIRRIKEKE